MFNTTLKQKYVLITAYVVRISFLVVLWGLPAGTVADVSAHSEEEAFLEGLPSQESTRSNSHTMRLIPNKSLQDYRSMVAGTLENHFDDHRVFLAAEAFPSGLRERLLSAAEVFVPGAPREVHRGGDGFTRDWTGLSESRDDSSTPRYQIFDPITVRDLILGEYAERSWLYKELQNNRDNDYALNDAEHCPDTTSFFEAPKNRFRIETHYQRKVTQRSWIDRYADGYHGVKNTIHCNRDYDAIIPSVEVVDKSLEAVYRPDGKMFSLRYEDRKGSSVFSEITLFF